MRIVIDMQGVQTASRFRGIGRYTISLVSAMISLRQQHEIILVLNARLQESIPNLQAEFKSASPLLQIRYFDLPSTQSHDDWSHDAAELLREAFIQSLAPDVVLVSSLFEGYATGAVTSIKRIPVAHKTATILYDLIPWILEEDYLTSSALRREYYKKLKSLRNADILLGISIASCHEAIEHLGISPDKTINISSAASPFFKPRNLSASATSVFLKQWGINRNMVLYTPGGSDARKNFKRLIEAYAKLPSQLRQTHQLVIASMLTEDTKKSIEGMRNDCELQPSELILTNYVSDEDLACLYSLSSLFVFPSIHEGFGLPILEAMSCGAVVIGSNSTSVPEVIGYPDALFDPLSVDEITAKIHYALTNESFRLQFRTHSAEQVKKFNWDRTAETAWKAIEALGRNMGTEICSEIEITSSTSSLLEQLAALPGKPSRTDLLQAAKCIAFNHPPTNRKIQVFVDITELVGSDARSGIQRVTRGILKACYDRAPTTHAIHPIYFTKGQYWHAYKYEADLKGINPAHADTPIDYFQGDIYLGLDLLIYWTDQIRPVHAEMSRHGVVMNYILYDLLPVHHPQWWPSPTANHFKDWLEWITTSAQRVICISNAVKNDYLQWLTTKHPDINNRPIVKYFHLGADIDNSQPSMGIPEYASQLLNSLRSHPTFLMVSTIEPRKGHAQVLAAFERLWLKGLDANLVFVGKPGWLVEDLLELIKKHDRYNNSLFWLAGISDEFLEIIYNNSDALISASEGEGFGLPLIEAAQHGLPIIARDIPVFREVAGEHAFYFRGNTSLALSCAIQKWLQMYEANIHPRSENIPWLTWSKSCDQLLYALEIKPVN